MNGVLIIDKPAGITSHDVVSRVRRILGTRRVGHTGTLDPFATGVMVVLVGKATRLAQFLDKDEKEYEAIIKFGFETDTGDRTGNPTSELVPGPPDKLAHVNWSEVTSAFLGETQQIPPMYSAKKIDGKKLYEHARKGEVIEREARTVNITKLEIAAGDDPDTMKMRVTCSAGTYVRTLAEDIGRKVGVGAHLTELRRTSAGAFGIAQSLTLNELAGRPEPEDSLLPLEVAVTHLAQMTLEPNRVEKTKGGLATRVPNRDLEDRQFIRMVDTENRLIAIGTYLAEENAVKPKVVLV